MRLFHCWIMIFILILPLVREITGATFFLLFPNENHELRCNTSTNQNQTGWWTGSRCSSLQTFEPMNSHPHGNPVKEQLSTHSIRNFSGGGVFACKALVDGKTPSQLPLFNNPEHCRDFDFFIVAIINNKTEKETEIESIHHQSNVVSPEEKGNFSLSCKFKLKNHVNFAVYWVKETNQTTCLLSISNEGHHILNNYSYDINCCVDTEIKKRMFSSSEGSEERHQNHQITIINAVPSDSGVYFCMVTAFSQKHFWKIVTNMSVEVQNALAPKSGNGNKTASSFTSALQISLGVGGSVLVIGGVIAFLCWKKNPKGKPSKQHQRDWTATEMKGEECSPYAISSHNDILGNEVVYSLAMSPGVNPNRASSLQYSEAVSGMQAGENVEAVYAVINKERS